MVHGDQKFEIRRPLVAGDVLTCDSTIESYKLLAGNEIVSVRSDLISDGEPVVSSWSTLVVRA
ncbi:MAG: MaoC family dehydratase N-terminal domain-containing protein [Actinomycetota bacterium]